MRGTEEKGVDVRMETDMISLAWVDNYDIAVLVSSDRDFVPVAEFLETRGIKVIHGAFPPKGAQLTAKCWANIDIARLRRFPPRISRQSVIHVHHLKRPENLPLHLILDIDSRGTP